MTADVVALLRELVAVDSANPSLVPGAAGERAIAGYVERWARDNGLSARIVAPDPARPSVVVRGGGGEADAPCCSAATSTPSGTAR
ncbi:hypothetical protein [Polymorphospora rubra]|uniref:Acetylornithine deacetylase n=1 Tax=Polymorphospora rubra TaxID=338584 RepID=A0A810N628_9ACTN|nr:hypothetical protein [Polymorphospora rubra]BCJ67639.1 hypothetical protein Prubr_46600 [Polymorphospora rubra]